MIFHSFQREDDDAVFTVAKNVSNAAMAAGDAVVWDSGSSVDGVRVTAPASGTLSLFRGIVAEAIADDAYGKVQVHGYCSNAQVTSHITIAAGNVLIPSTSKTLYYGAAGTGRNGYVYACEAQAFTSLGAKKVLIRAL